MSIHKLGTQVVIKLNKKSSIIDAAKLMKKHNIGDIIIVENESENKPIGILTDRDIAMKIVADDVDIKNICVGDAMSYDLLTLKKHQGIQEALDMMSAKGVRRAPILNDDGTISGIASIDDLLILIAGELSSLAKLVHKQIAD